MDAGRRHETPGSEILLLIVTAVNMNILLAFVPHASQVPQRLHDVPIESYKCSGFVSQLKNTELGESITFIKMKANPLFVLKKMLLYLSGLFLANAILKNGLLKEWSRLCILSIPSDNMQGPGRIASHNTKRFNFIVVTRIGNNIAIMIDLRLSAYGFCWSYQKSNISFPFKV